MKKITLSVTAALLMASNAFAVDTKIDNVKVEGAAGLYYGTSDLGAKGALFDQGNVADGTVGNTVGDAFVTLKATADLSKNMKAGISATRISTLGLENNLVSGTFTGSHQNAVDDFTVVSEAWLNLGVSEKTELILGRQQLDTPLVFSETWSVTPNTFEATIVQNKSINNVTLVGGHISAGNGSASVLAVNGEFTTFANNGAYAFGAIYEDEKSSLKTQVWAYNIDSTTGATDGATALWADVELAPDNGLVVGAQYTQNEGKAAGSQTNDATAFKVGYAKKDLFSVSAAYSTVGTTGDAGGNTGGGLQSKMYTEAWWNYGYVTRRDTTAMNVTAEYTISKGLEAGLYVTQTETTDALAEDMSEVTVSLAKEYEDFSATLVVIQADAEDQNKINGIATAYTTVQVYLDASF